MCTVHIWQSEDTCWDTLMCKDIHLGGSEDKRQNSNPHRWQCQVQFCRDVTGLLFSASLLPCSAFRSDSSWPIQAAYHSDSTDRLIEDMMSPVGWRRRSGWYQTLVYRWALAHWCISTAVVQHWSTFVVRLSQTWVVHQCKLDRRRQHVSVLPTFKMTQDCALYFLTSYSIAFISIDNKHKESENWHGAWWR